MSYLVLARKFRPQTFAEVVGQQAVVRTLQNALSQERVPHALIFSGVRGTGKTTLARVMAKALNCEQGPAAEPCNQCRSCREISEGSSIDLQEVDGASNRGIQEIRELKEKIRFLPTSSRYKIIIIDEVHMLTTEAFNALLKTLEEPPSHVYFMFATTELHKVPVTILSRCQRYELKRLGHKELGAHFSRLAAMEGVQMAPEALSMIVRESGGSVRDGLSLLDQVFSYCGRQVQAEEVIEVLGLVSHQVVADLGCALLAGDLGAVYSLLDALFVAGADSKRFCNDLLAWFRALIVCKVSKQPATLLDLPEEDLQRLQQIAPAHSLESLTAFFDLLLTSLEQAVGATQPRLALELACIRAVQYREVVPVADLIARFDQLLGDSPPQALPPVSTSLPSRQGAAAPLSSPRQAPPSAAPKVPVPSAAVAPEPGPAAQVAAPSTQPAAATSQLAPTAEPFLNDQTPATVAPQPEPELDANPQSPAPTSGQAQSPPMATPPPTPAAEPAKKRIRQHWDAFLKYVREREQWMAAALQMATGVERKGEEVIIRFADSADCTLLKQRSTVNELSEFMLDFFQENLRIQFEVPGSSACALSPENGSAPLQERRALANDPLVLTALDVFTGQVGEIRVGPSYRTRQPEPAAPDPDDRPPAEAEE